MARKATKAKAKLKAQRKDPTRPGRPQLKVKRADLRKAWKENKTVNGVAKALDIPWTRAKRELQEAKLV